MRSFRELLTHPLTRGHNLDAPQTTALRRRVIQAKPFLKRIYLDWYAMLNARLPSDEQHPLLELGSGAGFIETVQPKMITSDLLHVSRLKAVLDGHDLPFASKSLGGIVMINVLHHLPNPRRFFHEASRCIRAGGVIVMIEPWITPWSHQVYRHLHHEPIDPSAPTWNFDAHGPLSSANGALPWIIFHRDRDIFASEYPQWMIRECRPFMPFRYLVSGGISMRSLMPGFTYTFWKTVESVLAPWMDLWGMFAIIRIEKRG